MSTLTELTLECCDGIKLAAQKWETKAAVASNPYGSMGSPYGGMMNPGGGYGSSGGGDSNVKTTRILCVHGLYDNCRSFYYLAPKLVEMLSKSGSPYGGQSHKVELVAIDLPGHGKSTTRGFDVAPTIYLESVFYIAEAVKHLKWDEGNMKIHVIGHSYGGSLSLGYAATFPERVEKLVLLDRASPKYLDANTTVSNMRAHIVKRQVSAKVSQTQRMLYNNMQAAVDARVKAAGLNPGTQTISPEAAKELLERGTRKIGGGFQFSQDIKIDWPLMLELTEEQVQVINKAVKCPTAKLFAENGWPYDEEYIRKEDEALKPALRKILPGSHHFHADPATAKQVLDEVYKFLS